MNQLRESKSLILVCTLFVFVLFLTWIGSNPSNGFAKFEQHVKQAEQTKKERWIEADKQIAESVRKTWEDATDWLKAKP